MLRDDHATLVAFDTAVHAVCERAGDLVPLAGSDRAAYPVAAALVAAVVDGPVESVGERLAGGLARALDDETPAYEEASLGDPPAVEKVPDAEPAVREFLVSRGLTAEAAADVAATVSAAAAGFLAADYPPASGSDEAAPTGDRTYGFS